MHELAGVWADRRGRALIAVSAVTFALLLIPFNLNALVIAGITIRPAAMLPAALGILWGPAAAWGLGIGNIAGDLFGSWSLMSIPGFLVNFLSPYIAYLLWHRLMHGREVRTGAAALGCYGAAALVSTVSCMFLLALCGTLLFARPFLSKFISYAGNGILFAMLAGTVLFMVVLGPACRRGLVYGQEWDHKTE